MITKYKELYIEDDNNKRNYINTSDECYYEKCNLCQYRQVVLLKSFYPLGDNDSKSYKETLHFVYMYCDCECHPENDTLDDDGKWIDDEDDY